MPFRITPIVLNLLILNGLVFIAWLLIGDGYDYFMYRYFSLYKSDLILARPDAGMFFKPVQIVTHFFSHVQLWHISMNMVALASIGTPLELTIGSKRFLTEYLVAGIGGGIISAFLDPSSAPLVGASGAIAGILVSFALRFPTTKLQLMLIPIRFTAMRGIQVFAGISALFIALEIFNITDGSFGNISHFGHFTGMAVAFIYLQGWKKEYWNRNRRR